MTENNDPIKKPDATNTELIQTYKNNSSINPKLQVAIDYAVKHSRKVLPLFFTKTDGSCSCGSQVCSSVGKHPIGRLVPRGALDATDDVNTIMGWFTQEPFANIAIATGEVSNIVVLDIDPRNGGNESLAELERQCGRLPETLTVVTGGNGRHYYFKYSGQKLSVKLTGIDFQSDGKYVVAPPSNHQSGQTYRWVDKDCPIAELPEIFYSTLNIHKPSLANTELIPQGMRNQKLASLAGKLRREGMELKHIREIIRRFNFDKCSPPLPEHEVDRIAESISKYDPKSVPQLTKLDRRYLKPEEIDSLINKPMEKAQMNFEVLPLPIRKFREWATNSTHAPDEFVVNGFIGAVAAVMGKDIVLEHPLGDIRAHLWIANIANSGEGKTTALNIAGKLLSEIEMPLLEEKRLKLKEYKILYEKYLKDRKTGRANEADEPVYPSIRTVTLPALTSIQKLVELLAKDYAGGIIYVPSELSLVLSDWKLDRNAGMIPFYLSLFDSPDIAPTPAYKNAEDLPLIKNPAVSIVGASVDRSFLSRFTEEDFVSGNLQRWLIATTRNNKPRMAFPEPSSEEGKQLFKILLETIFNLAKVQGVEIVRFQFSDEARQYWYDSYPALNDKYKAVEEPHIISSLTRIDDSYTLKFALIFECAKQVYNNLTIGAPMETTLSKESVEEAIALADYFKQSLLEVISRLETDSTRKMMKQVVSKLRSSEGLKMKANDLKNLCNGFKYQKNFDNAVESLRRLGVITTTFADNNSSNNSLTEFTWLLEE